MVFRIGRACQTQNWSKITFLPLSFSFHLFLTPPSLILSLRTKIHSASLLWLEDVDGLVIVDMGAAGGGDVEAENLEEAEGAGDDDVCGVVWIRRRRRRGTGRRGCRLLGEDVFEPAAEGGGIGEVATPHSSDFDSDSDLTTVGESNAIESGLVI